MSEFLRKRTILRVGTQLAEQLMMIHSLSRSLSLVLATAALSYAPTALACSYAECGAPVRVFDEGARIPGNLVYFKVFEKTATLSLETTDGAPIAASAQTIGGDLVFAPDAPIAAGTHVRLKHAYHCTKSKPAKDVAGTYEFETVESAELTIRPIEFVLAPARDEDPTLASIRFNTAAAEHLVDHEVTIDGKLAWLAYEAFGEPRRLDFTTFCGDGAAQADSCNVYDNFPEGVHTVQVKSLVVGLDADPAPATFEVKSSCTQPPVAGKGLTDSQMRGTDAGTGASGRELRGVGECDGSVCSEPGKTTDDGCSVGGQGGASGVWLLGLLAFVWRRRTGQRAHRVIGS